MMPPFCVGAARGDPAAGGTYGLPAGPLDVDRDVALRAGARRARRRGGPRAVGGHAGRPRLRAAADVLLHLAHQRAGGPDLHQLRGRAPGPGLPCPAPGDGDRADPGRARPAGAGDRVRLALPWPAGAAAGRGAAGGRPAPHARAQPDAGAAGPAGGPHARGRRRVRRRRHRPASAEPRLGPAGTAPAGRQATSPPSTGRATTGSSPRAGTPPTRCGPGSRHPPPSAPPGPTPCAPRSTGRSRSGSPASRPSPPCRSRARPFPDRQPDEHLDLHQPPASDAALRAGGEVAHPRTGDRRRAPRWCSCTAPVGMSRRSPATSRRCRATTT